MWPSTAGEISVSIYKLFCSENAMSLFNVLRTCHKCTILIYIGAVHISPANRDDPVTEIFLGSQKSKLLNPYLSQLVVYKSRFINK